jgi:hypothetical protein
MTYQIDCSLGQATGTYTYTEDRITFTPVKSGINGGSMGNVDVYPYTFIDENSLYLDAKGNKVKLMKIKT